MTTFDGTAPRASAPGRALGRGWLLALTVLILWGFAAWIYQLTQGLIVTGMRDEVSWGLYICTFAFFVGLSAGGLIMASASHVFGIESLRPLSRVGVLTAGACVLVAAMTLIPDLGQPQRLWELFRYPNWTSPMIWDVIIVLSYLAFAIVDLVVMTRRGTPPETRNRRLRVLAFIGLPGAVLLHSVTAWIFGVQIARPWWNTAMLAPAFVTSAILSGTALVGLVALAARRFGGLELSEQTLSAIRKLTATGLCVDLFLIGADYITILWGNQPSERAALDLVLPGGSWQWVFWLEWVVGGLIPFVLLVLPRWRRRPGVMVAAFALVLAGVYGFRVELIEGGMLKPLLDLPPGLSLGSFTPGASSFQFLGSYHPTWVEYSIVVALLSFLALLITLGYRWLRSLEPAQGERR